MRSCQAAMVSAGALTGQRLLTMVPSAQLTLAISASSRPKERPPPAISGRPRQASPAMPSPSPTSRRRSIGSARTKRASSVAQIGMVKVRIAAREVGATS
ncbi:hypothetical protein [Bosea massiliensis]|uniref:Uncharacterized protein n=1 Tax=Bosea massiliensis TaxID=151419 RepID=A0ABW0NZ99_9HYPH